MLLLDVSITCWTSQSDSETGFWWARLCVQGLVWTAPHIFEAEICALSFEPHVRQLCFIALGYYDAVALWF